MTVCLYECLRAAGLQHHYDRFTLVGVCRAAHLSSLKMEDYSLLGVHSMEDRTRLFHLVQLVKTLDLKSLLNDDVVVYNENVYDGGDEDYSAVDGRFSPDGYGNPDEDLSDNQDENKASMGSSSFAGPSHVRRRLEFTVESSHPAQHNKNGLPVHGNESATPMQHTLLSRRFELNGHRESKTHKFDVHKCLHDCQNEEKLHIKRGPSVFNYDIRLLPNSKTSHKHHPSPVTVTSKTINNKSLTLKERKVIYKRKIYSTGMTKPIPVYEAKRTAGYNYGLPLTSPRAPNNKYLGGQRISVCVRKRPLTRAECRRREADVVTTPAGDCVVVHESKEAVDLTEYILQHRFYFDHVFGEESSNEEVYQKTVYPLVQHMLSGGKATCFAYGQTGAGKTYTMLGSCPGRPGLYALAVQDIFAHLSATHSYCLPQLVYVSFFEIYCGQLYDLLDHRKRVFAREDRQKMVHISGLCNVRVDSVSSLLEVISQGTAERTQGMSGVNPLSSRSHALLQIQLRDLNQQTTGRMCFVDLAGSERASDAKEPDRQTRMEGAEINQSLLALKECIRSLDREESHTPFRQSKLTQVLKDSFVGDSITCMIANISPGRQATEHTLNTLRYADRVKELKGQGEQKEKKRCETGLSSKYNMSNSNKSQSNVGAVKKPKSIGPSKPAKRIHTDSTFLCSTPKNSSCGQKTQSRIERQIGLEHITPVRGWLPNGDGGHWSKQADEKEGRRMKNERYRSCNSHCVREKSTRAAPVHKQLTKQQQNKEEALESYLAFAKVESGFQLRERENHQLTIKERRKEQTKWIEKRGQTGSLHSCRSNKEERQRERNVLQDDDKEKMRHLRQYHQQLQQLILSSTSSSADLLSSSTCPSSSSSSLGSLSPSLHSSCCSYFTQMDHKLNGFSDVHTDRVDVDCYRRQISLLRGEDFVQNQTSAKYCMNNDVDIHGSYGGVREDQRVGKCESERKRLAEATSERNRRREHKQCAWVAKEEMESANRMTSAPPTNVEAPLICSWDSVDRGDLIVEGLEALDAPDNGVWSIGQIEAANYHNLESAHSSFSPPPFESQHQRAPAERPLSPPNENAIVVLTSDKLNETSDESKNNKQDCSVLILPFQNISEAVPLNSANIRLFSHIQSTTYPVTTAMTLTESLNKPSECPVYTQSGNHPDFRAKMSVLPLDETSLESFNYTMDPLSISLLHADQQPATASFLRGHTSNTCLCVHKSENGDDHKGETGKESFSGVETEREIVEDEDAEFHLSLLEPPHVKTFHPTAPATSNTTLLSLHDGENDQKNLSALDYKAPASSGRTPLMSLPIQHTENTSSLAVHKTPSCSFATQPLENVLGHLDIVHSNQSIISKVSPKPSKAAEPRGQESNSNQQIRPTTHLFTMDSLNHAKWCVVEAHLEQLKEVNALSHKEGKLLCQRHDMAFGEYVHKLAEILERKARCVHSMRAQLQPYLKPILSNHHPSTQGDNHDSAV